MRMSNLLKILVFFLFQDTVNISLRAQYNSQPALEHESDTWRWTWWIFKYPCWSGLPYYGKRIHADVGECSSDYSYGTLSCVTVTSTYSGIFQSFRNL